MENLYDASRQWAVRPPDERFASVPEMLATCSKYWELAQESSIPVNKLEVVASSDNEVRLVGQSGRLSNLSHWSFGQLAIKARAPANYLRTLPAHVAGDCLNDGFKHLKTADISLELLFHQTTRNG